MYKVFVDKKISNKDKVWKKLDSNVYEVIIYDNLILMMRTR